MPAVPIEKFEPLDDPRIEAALHVLGNLARNVRPILQPLQFGTRGRGPHCFFAFFAMVTVTHCSVVYPTGLRCSRRSHWRQRYATH